MDASSPFTDRVDVTPRKWYHKFFSAARPDAASQKIVGLFVDRDPGDISPNEISGILSDEKVLGSASRQLRIWVWRQAVEVHIADNVLTDAEMAYLERLRTTLALSPSDVLEVQDELALGRFKKAAEIAFSDGQLSESEKIYLGKLGEELRLPYATVRDECSSQAGTILQAEFDKIAESRRYSPAHEAHLRKRAGKLGMANLSLGPDATRQFARFRVLWEVENGQLPVIDCGLNLQKGEVCHTMFATKWLEIRSRTTRVNYGGVTSRIRVARGVYLRAGSFAPQQVTKDELTEIDQGTAFITNKRLIFDGGRANKVIRHSALLGFEVFSDALKLEKATGRSPYLAFDGDIEMIAAVLGAAMAA